MKRQIDDDASSEKGEVMLKKLLLTLFLGIVISGPATPIFKNVFGIGPSHAYAADDNGQGDNDDQGEDGDVDGQ